MQILGNLSKDVFERRTSTGSEVFSLLICLDANKFVLLSFSSLIKTIYPRVSTEPLPNDAKSPLPVDVRRSKTPLLKLPTAWEGNGGAYGAVVRARASHQCGPGANPGAGAMCGLSLLLVLSFSPRGFSAGTPVFPSAQKPTF